MGTDTEGTAEAAAEEAEDSISDETDRLVADDAGAEVDECPPRPIPSERERSTKPPLLPSISVCAADGETKPETGLGLFGSIGWTVGALPAADEEPRNESAKANLVWLDAETHR